MQEQFFEHLKKQYSTRAQSVRTASWRELFWQRFCALGLPKKEDEHFQYFPLQAIYAGESEDLDQGQEYSFERQENQLVFVDGEYRPDLSSISSLPKSVSILPLEEAAGFYGAFLQNRWRKQLQEEKNSLVLLNFALCQGGLFIYVPPQTVLETPLQILHIVSSRAICSPCVYICMGAFSKAECLWKTIGASAAIWQNEVIDASLEEGSTLSLYSVCANQSRSCHTTALRASVKKNANLQATPLLSNLKVSRYDYHVSLLGENSKATIKGLSALEEDLHSHVYGVMEHIAPHTESMQLFKTVAKDRSRASFQGKIIVRDTAQKTQAYQLSKQLLLGENAICNVKPNLEIFADDVKASHGATIAQISEEELFYLKTRGIFAEDAKRLFIEGFCREILQDFPNSASLQPLC